MAAQELIGTKHKTSSHLPTANPLLLSVFTSCTVQK
jgi:hypothetical protein